MTTYIRPALSCTFVDKAKKASTFEINVTEADIIDEENAVNTNVTDLAQAVAAVSFGFFSRKALVVAQEAFPLVIPTDDAAYNSAKIAITLQDNVNGKKTTKTIPARNPAKFNTLAGTNTIILANAAGGGSDEIAALKTKIELTGRSIDGNAVTVLEMRVEGRNVG